MPNTIPSETVCPDCHHPHANLAPQGISNLRNLGLSEEEIGALSNLGTLIASEPGTPPHRTVDSGDAARFARFGLSPDEVAGITAESYARALDLDSPDDLDPDILECIGDPDFESYLTLSEGINEQLVQAEKERTRRESSRARQARHRAKTKQAKGESS